MILLSYTSNPIEIYRDSPPHGGETSRVNGEQACKLLCAQANCSSIPTKPLDNLPDAVPDRPQRRPTQETQTKMTAPKKFKDDDAVRLKCERAALALMNLRGSPAARADTVISPEVYTHVAGFLKRVCKLTGETPRKVCDRLRIHGAHRKGLMPQETDRFRLNAHQLKDSYRARDTQRGGKRAANDEEYWRRRCEITGLTEAELRAKDHAFDKRIKAMRMASGPPHPSRKIQQYADPPRRKQR